MHEKTQDTVRVCDVVGLQLTKREGGCLRGHHRVLVRIPRTLIDGKGEAWPYQVLELMLMGGMAVPGTWMHGRTRNLNYYLLGNTIYLAALFTLIINLFYLFLSWLHYALWLLLLPYLSSILTVIISFLKRFDFFLIEDLFCVRFFCFEINWIF